MNDAKLLRCFEVLSTEAKELYVRRDVPVIESPVNPLTFYREWVSPNNPVVIKAAVKHWPAIRKWTNDYLRDKMGHKVVKVAATPNGYADAIADGYFVMPEEREMTVKDFLSVIEDPASLPGTVLYVQSQNGNLGGEWADLVHDIDASLSWATEAFGEPPSAANFWMGDGRAVTSMHRDPFENIYCVVRGHKDFILHPPTDLPWLPYSTLPAATYQFVPGNSSTSKFEIKPMGTWSENKSDSVNEACKETKRNSENAKQLDCCGKSFQLDTNKLCLDNTCSGSDIRECVNNDSSFKADSSKFFEDDNQHVSRDPQTCGSFEDVKNSYVPWVCIDPERPDLQKYPLYKNATQVRVRVHAGDVLFLPAHWFHHVKQSHACIAINFWYDVQFDHRYAHQAFITALLQNSGLNTGCPPMS